MASLSVPLALLLGGEGAITPVDTSVLPPQAAAALDRLAQQYKGQPNIQALITITAEQYQDAADVAATLTTMLQPDASIGVQLDKLGSVVGEPRQGFDDGSYAQHIKARIFLNRSSGTVPELLAMFAFILGSGFTLTVREYFPGSFQLTVGGYLDPATAKYLLSFLRAGKPAGVRAFLEWSSTTPANTFTFAGGGDAGFNTGIFASTSN